MRLRYTLRAQADLEAIFDYLDQAAPLTAAALRAEITKRVTLLLAFPLMAPATEIPGVRECSMSRFPYNLYYEIRGDELCVLHVRHARRRPWEGDRQ
jgi:toxin ParE1/3/4